jgi:sodium transport system ATP-binding protein
VATSRVVRDMLRRFREEGRCILLSSHIMQEVWALADRIVVVCEGEVAAQGTPAELRRATGLDDVEEIFLASVANRTEPALDWVAA